MTAWQNSTSVGPVNSIYLFLRERNLCNHRDYQNLGLNGARVGSIDTDTIHTLARNQTIDRPVLMIYESVGNDVCTGHHTTDRMTTPQEFASAVLDTLNQLDKVLPKGSHIVFIGLVDGRILWDTLWNRTHPIGVPYAQVYEFLNCLYISPCYLWMNENETLRNAASDRAAQLSAVYSQIIANYTFKNFDMIYYPFALPEIIKQWTAMGGQTWQLIEPIDGFHPSQISNALWARNLWSQLQIDRPGWLGPVNPNNGLIQKLFGNQGGYV